MRDYTFQKRLLAALGQHRAALASHPCSASPTHAAARISPARLSLVMLWLKAVRCGRATCVPLACLSCSRISVVLLPLCANAFKKCFAAHLMTEKGYCGIGTDVRSTLPGFATLSWTNRPQEL